MGIIVIVLFLLSSSSLPTFVSCALRTGFLRYTMGDTLQGYISNSYGPLNTMGVTTNPSLALVVSFNDSSLPFSLQGYGGSWPAAPYNYVGQVASMDVRNPYFGDDANNRAVFAATGFTPPFSPPGVGIYHSDTLWGPNSGVESSTWRMAMVSPDPTRPQLTIQWVDPDRRQAPSLPCTWSTGAGQFYGICNSKQLTVGDFVQLKILFEACAPCEPGYVFVNPGQSCECMIDTTATSTSHMAATSTSALDAATTTAALDSTTTAAADAVATTTAAADIATTTAALDSTTTAAADAAFRSTTTSALNSATTTSMANSATTAALDTATTTSFNSATTSALDRATTTSLNSVTTNANNAATTFASAVSTTAAFNRATTSALRSATTTAAHTATTTRAAASTSSSSITSSASSSSSSLFVSSSSSSTSTSSRSSSSSSSSSSSTSPLQ
eukprot:TRINITY_DN2283_c5_g1_i1.p1 TRINITY_DN2283_c5_g1~~TRINITY_DN2283_c5_g1_i1.p1  ORF type:complete len:444 (+),score=109.20 TRINITY_DN2283_c5_g1_i1:56-1387(+)